MERLPDHEEEQREVIGKEEILAGAGDPTVQGDDEREEEGFITPELLLGQSSSRPPFTSRSQVDADLALARALQQQERAYMLLHMSNEGSEYDTSGSGSCDYEYVNDADDEDDAHVLACEQPPLELDISLSSQEEEEDGELNGTLYESDEAFARALQEAEHREATAHIMALAGINDYSVGENDEEESSDSQDAWQDVDPDNMSYEELIALGEAVGTHSRGLAADVIAALPYSKYVQEDGETSSLCDPCVICRLDYEDGDALSTLPCKHQYHVDCIKNWLQINKVCPLCSAEVA